jgi:hypothetical protein
MKRVHSKSEHKRIAAQGGRILDDGFGNQWVKCEGRCGLEIVRPGKVQCEVEWCPLRAGPQSGVKDGT